MERLLVNSGLSQQLAMTLSSSRRSGPLQLSTLEPARDSAGAEIIRCLNRPDLHDEIDAKETLGDRGARYPRGLGAERHAGRAALDATWDEIYTAARCPHRTDYSDDELPVYQARPPKRCRIIWMWQVDLTPFSDTDVFAIATSIVDAVDDTGHSPSR